MPHLTIQQTSERWGCHHELVRDHIKAGRLRAINIGSDRRPTWRIDESALREFEDGRRAEAPAPVERQARRKKLPANIKKFVALLLCCGADLMASLAAGSAAVSSM